MALEKKEVSRFAVIDVTGGKVGNAYFEIREVIEEDGAQVGGTISRNVPAELSEVSAFIGADNVALAEANKTLNTQNTALQAEVQSLTERFTAEVQSLTKRLAAAEDKLEKAATATEAVKVALAASVG